MFKNALVSVSDKSGLKEFLKPLVEQGLRVVSTGGTARYLKENGIPVVQVSEQTQFPEVMDGRVRTLHPFIHMPLLARQENQEDMDLLKKYELSPFDLVIGNLYPFEKYREKQLSDRELTEYIDIGGPSLLRAAAKNFETILTLCDPKDYEVVLKKALSQDGISLKERKKYGAKIFSHISNYDRQIAEYFDPEGPEASALSKASFATTGSSVKSILDSFVKDHLKEYSDFNSQDISMLLSPFVSKGKAWVENLKSTIQSDLEHSQKSKQDSPKGSPKDFLQKNDKEIFSETKIQLLAEPFLSLRYGENPQQKAIWFKSSEEGLHNAKILSGKALSFNNVLDLNAALSSLFLFDEPCCVAVKHNNSCGIAIADHIEEATAQALKGDPLSVFGGILALNRDVTSKTAGMISSLFLECVVAPSFEKEALDLLREKRNLRVLEYDVRKLNEDYHLHSLPGGFLLQSKDQVETHWESSWTVIGEGPSEKTKRDLSFAWKVCATLKSNAIAIVEDGKTLGLGMGQVSRIDSVEQAIGRMKKYHPDYHNPVLASDAFFPFEDSIELAHQSGIKWIIQPGGSVKDEQVLAKAKSLGVNMVLTGVRHFRH